MPRFLSTSQAQKLLLDDNFSHHGPQHVFRHLDAKMQHAAFQKWLEAATPGSLFGREISVFVPVWPILFSLVRIGAVLINLLLGHLTRLSFVLFRTLKRNLIYAWDVAYRRMIMTRAFILRLLWCWILELYGCGRMANHQNFAKRRFNDCPSRITR